MKKLLILFLLLIFTLSACNQADSNNNSSPANASSPTSSDSDDQNNSSKSKRTGDIVELDFLSEEIVKIEYLGHYRQENERRVTEDSVQINEVIQLLKTLVITDDAKEDFNKLGGGSESFVMYFKSGDSVEINYLSAGGVVISKDNWQYADRWLAAKGNIGDELYQLLSNLH